MILGVLGMILWVLGMIFGLPFKYLEYTRYNFRGTMYNIGDTGYNTVDTSHKIRIMLSKIDNNQIAKIKRSNIVSITRKTSKYRKSPCKCIKKL